MGGSHPVLYCTSNGPLTSASQVLRFTGMCHYAFSGSYLSTYRDNLSNMCLAFKSVPTVIDFVV